MEALFIDKLKAAVGAGWIGIEELSGRTAAVVAPESILVAGQVLRDDPELSFDVLMDLGAADYKGFGGEPKPARFGISIQFFSSTKKHRAWLKTYVSTQAAEIDSLVKLYPAANWYEREAWDMYGIVFKGHPYLKRILLYEEFEGFPLRKDYPIGKMQPLVPMRDSVDYESVVVARRQENKD